MTAKNHSTSDSPFLQQDTNKLSPETRKVLAELFDVYNSQIRVFNFPEWLSIIACTVWAEELAAQVDKESGGAK